MTAQDNLNPQQFRDMTPRELAENHWDPNMGSPGKLYEYDKPYFDKTLIPDIAANGVQDPLELRNGRIHEGHHRTVAALRLGIPLLRVRGQ